MLDLHADFFTLAEADRVVLYAYYLADQTLPTEQSRQLTGEREEIERMRWVKRIGEVDGVPGDSLAPIHGRLIASGCLQFQLQGRDAGVVYRITTEGRAALSAAAVNYSSDERVRRSA